MKTRIALILTIVLTLAGCGERRAVRQTLLQADRLVCLQPDSALQLLETLDCGDADKELAAWHALLLVKANEKALIRFHNDSLTAMAADYYRGSGDSLEIQSLYYNGVILGYNRKYADALISLIEAAEKAILAHDDFYSGMAYREQADIYRALMAESKHLEYADSARRFFEKADRPEHALEEALSISEALISLDSTEKALKELASIRNNKEMKSAPAFNAAYHRAMANARMKQNDFIEALCHLDSVEQFAGELTSAEWSKKARVFCAVADYKSAEKALDEAGIYMFEPQDSAELSLSEATLAAGIGDYHSAYEAFSRHYLAHEDSQRHLLTHPYTAVVSDYYKEQSERRQEELGATRRIMWMSVSIVLLLFALVISVILFYRRKLREKADRHEILVSDIERLQKITPRHHTIVNTLCELTARMPETNDGYAILGKNTARLISTLHSEDAMKEMEAFVNDYSDNIMARLRDQYPGMTERNYRFAMLAFAEFSTQSITAILDLKSTGAARTMRHRIRKHIEEIPAKDRDIFLARL